MENSSIRRVRYFWSIFHKSIFIQTVFKTSKNNFDRVRIIFFTMCKLLVADSDILFCKFH